MKYKEYTRLLNYFENPSTIIVVPFSLVVKEKKKNKALLLHRNPPFNVKRRPRKGAKKLIRYLYQPILLLKINIIQ